MTFSRGGLVAAAAALLYLIGQAVFRGRKRETPWRKRADVWQSLFLIAVLAGGTIWNGLGARSTEALGKDASVGNRMELWNGALQMAAENIHGFGTGKSGEQYINGVRPRAFTSKAPNPGNQLSQPFFPAASNTQRGSREPS